MDREDWIREAITARAETLGLSAYAIGKHCEIDPGTVKRYLSGRCALNSRYVSAICMAIGLTLKESQPEIESEQAG